MNELRRTEPRIISGKIIYDFDYTLPFEYAPAINIRTIFNENSDIIVDPSWEENYCKIYAKYHKIEHIDKTIDNRVYVSIEDILKYAKLWTTMVEFRNFTEDHISQHICLSADGYGSTYLSIYIYNPTSPYIES